MTKRRTPTNARPLRWFAVGWLASCACALACRLAQPSRPLSVPPPGKAATEQIPMLKEVGIDQKLDAQVPLDRRSSTRPAQPSRSASTSAQRPVVLALVYYECPMLCTQVLNGLVGSLEGLSFTAGKEFDVRRRQLRPGRDAGDGGGAQAGTSCAATAATRASRTSTS